VKSLTLTNDEAAVLRHLLTELTDAHSWLNSKWLDGARAHEVVIVHRLARRPYGNVQKDVQQ